MAQVTEQKIFRESVKKKQVVFVIRAIMSSTLDMVKSGSDRYIPSRPMKILYVPDHLDKYFFIQQVGRQIVPQKSILEICSHLLSMLVQMLTIWLAGQTNKTQIEISQQILDDMP